MTSTSSVSESNQTTSGGPLSFGFPFQSSPVGTLISALPLLLVLFLPGLAAVALFVGRQYSANQRARDARQPASSRRTDQSGYGPSTNETETARESESGASGSLLGGDDSEPGPDESLLGGDDDGSGPSHDAGDRTGEGPDAGDTSG